VNDDLGHFVALTDGINYLQALNHLTKAGVIAVEMRGIAAAVANEKLGTSGVAAGMRHGKYPAIVKLIAAAEFAVNLITRTSGTGSGRVAALNNKIRYHAVKGDAIIKALPGKAYKILYGVGGVLIVEFDLHHALFGVYFSCCHSW